jgi:hypothetical protein
MFNIMNIRLVLISLVYTHKRNSSKMCLNVKHMVMRRIVLLHFLIESGEALVLHPANGYSSHQYYDI